MTYNFDPDRWYDNELAVLDHHLETAAISVTEYEEAKDDLEYRYEAMVTRLDGTYCIDDRTGN